MSKYNLIDLVEGMSRGGTINDSFYSIANLADDIEGKNIGKDTYPIEVKRLGASEDGKVNEEIVVRYGEGHKDYFSIYDYKFGEDPTDEDNYDNDYPFSLGIPIGNKDGKQWAAKLGFNVEGMNEESIKEDAEEDAKNDADYEAGWADDPRKDESVDMVKEEEGFTEVSTKEIKFHLDAYKEGTINGEDLAQAIEEIVFGETKAPGTMEESDTLNEDCCAKAKAALKGEDENQVDLYLKSLKNDIKLNGEDGYKDYSSEDFVEDFKEYIGNKSVAEHFKRFM